MSKGTILVSWSEIDAGRQCPKKHELTYKEGWRPPGTAPALAKGSLWHEVMEAHYRTLFRAQQDGGHLTPQAFMKVVFPLLYDSNGQQTEYQELVEWMYEGYLQQYELDPEWRIVAVEHAGQAWLPTDRGGRSRFKLVMKVDLIVSYKKKIYLIDHKSGKDLPKDIEFDLMDQFGLYTWCLRQLGHNVHGVLHSAARTQRNQSAQTLDSRFKRHFMYRTDTELDTIAKEAYATLRHVYGFPTGEAPRAPDPDRCKWRCPFTDPCLSSRRGYDIEDYLVPVGFTKEPEKRWDYYGKAAPT